MTPIDQLARAIELRLDVTSVTRELEQLQRLQQHRLRSPHCVDLTHGYGQGGN